MMRTHFRHDQLDDPEIKRAETVLRTCVHCGFCTATCPTYVLLCDERDSPRGRIALIQNMLENDGPPSPETVFHIDRCISCLGCSTACPSGVDYSVLIDAARAHIDRNFKRPWRERFFRAFVLLILMKPRLFSATTTIARLFAPIASRFPGRLGTMARKVPPRVRHSAERAAVPDMASATQRVAILPGCVQKAMAPAIDAAARRVLAREHMATVPLAGAGCCGALAFHMGKTAMAKRAARSMIAAYETAHHKKSLDAVLSTATGCTAFLKEYERLFADDEQWAGRAKSFAAKVRDFIELPKAPLQPVKDFPLLELAVAYHPPCSLQHGQRIVGRGEELLAAAGIRLKSFADSHLCCGSAGSYSLLQPGIAADLRARKLAAIKASGADVIVSGNLGCITHLTAPGAPPAIHIAELLDWAGGGPKPEALSDE